eukprot:CAMPEP_0197461962 /NCGR_PEP_ID=MMETSP1175-20131217/57845_1 /TAXON_ID=1003142 /ORGANISM="Triceratium dubium, Strain CCMP147" /LENGTH=145 /DNA_ID=CAMNT_0042997353 /DNA_START=50 /DNA_END=484 /DNA_ORIENTATION=+
MTALAHCKIEVRIFEFCSPQFSSKTYHSDISFHHNEHVAFFTNGVQPQSVWGNVVHTIVEYKDMDSHEFWKIKERLVNDWSEKDYDVANRNCNHFTDACLKAYGFDGLPGGYFSRGDHVDKQVWNWVAQHGGLTPKQADKLGAEW